MALLKSSAKLLSSVVLLAALLMAALRSFSPEQYAAVSRAVSSSLATFQEESATAPRDPVPSAASGDPPGHEPSKKAPTPATPPPSPLGIDDTDCFCQLSGSIDHCRCDFNTVDHFNNQRLYDRLQKLLRRPYFRYFHYNPNKSCRYWNDADGKCGNPSCGVRTCATGEVPQGIVEGQCPGTAEESCANADDDDERNKEDCAEDADGQSADDAVDETLSDSARASLEQWREHDDRLNPFCDVDADHCPECTYVDLTLNPERFTGYDGPSAHRVWGAIYEENCFDNAADGVYSLHEQDQCTEKQMFFQLISGLHTSITVHLCANYPQKDSAKLGGPPGMPFGFQKERWGPNQIEFRRRFDPRKTDGPQWLRNLYFLYLVELRALVKATDYLQGDPQFFTGDEHQDAETRRQVADILELAADAPDQFDETIFAELTDQVLKQQLQERFRNISRIMDCVGCDKCKLWGKLQVTGLGTALKILFHQHKSGGSGSGEFRLSRNEIVSLFNAFGRISTSVAQVGKFRDMGVRRNFP